MLKMKIGYGREQEFEIDIAQGSDISVKVTKPKSKNEVYKPTEFFNRSYAQDVINDIRWVLNFSGKELYDEPLEVERRKNDNFFYTPNALFYTFSLSGKHYLLQKTKDGEPVGAPAPLQDIGEFFAGDIECEDGGTITIEIKDKDGNVEEYPLKKDALVFFDNRCLSNVPECANDFIHYYDVIKSVSEKFEIKYSPTLAEKWIKEPFGVKGTNYACEVAKVCCVKNPEDTLNYPVY